MNHEPLLTCDYNVLTNYLRSICREHLLRMRECSSTHVKMADDDLEEVCLFVVFWYLLGSQSICLPTVIDVVIRQEHENELGTSVKGDINYLSSIRV